MEEVGALPAPPAYTLSLMAHETPHGLHLQWEADAALLDQEDLDQTARSYALLLEQVLTDPKQSVDTLALLSPQEQTQLLAASRGTVRPLAAETVVSAIETAVDRTPQAPAVIAQGEHLSYAALEEKANRLAHHLRALGMGAGRVVGLLPERNARLVVAILGILKAGAAYLPLDPTQPPERLRFMLEESCASAVVMAASLAGSLDLPAGCRPVLLENPALTEQPGHRPNAAAGPADPMYVVYTSGSTGAPKGVVISHGAAQNFVDWARRVYDLTPTDRVLQFASIGFDTAVEEIFPTLAAGATLLINPDRWRGGIADFLHWPARHGVTVLDLPTALWHTWVTAPDQAQPHLPASVRLVIVGGEEARAADYAAWRRRIGPDVRWINTYGPSEATVVALAFEPPPTWDAVRQGMPIGRPLDNVYAYVLDAQGRLAPPGAAGELYLGGAGLADGYLHSPELTAERFIAPPWSDTENAPARLYRTGDRVRRRADGLLEFLGRVDDQVKLRGYRVEPDEIAAVLRRHAAVQDAAVQVYGLNDRTSTDQDEPAPEPRLVAYVVPCAGVELSTAALRDHCTASLPDYMTPTTFITLPALPLSPGGKVDRRRLPMPDSTRAGAEEAGAPPASPLETLLAGIWCELLDLPAVGRDDNFFTLGGHSLLTIRLAARVVDLLKVDLPLRRYFEAPTVARQAACLRRDPTMGARVDRLAELVLQLADLSDEEVVQRLAARRAAAQPAGQEP